MLTPSFTTSQDDNFVYIRIRVPHIKISDVDVDVDGCTFKFYLRPYFLRLVLPGEVAEDDDAKAKYDVTQGEVVVQLSKVQKGEYFHGLDMLTTLLAKSKKHSKPVVGTALIQVMDDGEDTGAAAATGSGGEEEDDEEEDWEVEQELFDESAFERLSLSGPKYGFANQSCGVFARFQGEALGVVELPEPDSTPASQRRALRIAAQDRKFDEDHYLTDFVSTDDLRHTLDFTPYYNEQHDKYKKFLKEQSLVANSTDLSSTSAQSGERPVSSDRDIQAVGQEKFVTFTSEELDKLKELPNKEYLLDRQLSRCTYLGLVDLMLAYAYNHRSTCGDNTVESSWTVAKISNLLSWLEWFPSLRDVVVAATRNMLSYPLYRHWKLAKLVLRDVTCIFSLGRRQILKCLLEIRSLLLDEENRYLLNDLYMTDYCVWVQKASQSKIKAIADRLLEIKLSKRDVGWQLSELEEAARSVQHEHDTDTAHAVQEGMEQDEFTTGHSSCDDESTSGSSDSSSDSDDSSDSSDESSEEDDDNVTDKHQQSAAVAKQSTVDTPPTATAAAIECLGSPDTTASTGGLLAPGVLDKPTSLTGHAYHCAADETPMTGVAHLAAECMETSSLQVVPSEPAVRTKPLIEEL